MGEGKSGLVPAWMVSEFSFRAIGTNTVDLSFQGQLPFGGCHNGRLLRVGGADLDLQTPDHFPFQSESASRSSASTPIVQL